MFMYMHAGKKHGIATVYAPSFKGCNFQGFCGQLTICKIFILESSLAKLRLGSIREQDT